MSISVAYWLQITRGSSAESTLVNNRQNIKKEYTHLTSLLLLPCQCYPGFPLVSVHPALVVITASSHRLQQSRVSTHPRRRGQVAGYQSRVGIGGVGDWKDEYTDFVSFLNLWWLTVWICLSKWAPKSERFDVELHCGLPCRFLDLLRNYLYGLCLRHDAS